MAQYDLDKLGWIEFEPLIQTLLKSKLGLGVEAWGGSSDEGRDAYFPGKLRYPTNAYTPGPFVFQAKFVRGANAAGANSLPSIKKAVAAEAKRIKERLPPSPRPKHYSLLTNVPLTVSARRDLSTILKPSLPGCDLHFHDGNDICRWLDLAPRIASRFPQLFTIADLISLLKHAGNQGITTRSEVAVQMAKDSAKVFVPTRPYFAARQKLKRFGFCILEGPPEMGKTTIGRMIAMCQMIDGWDAIECKAPKEFHDVFDSKGAQIFVADDFFGRTDTIPLALVHGRMSFLIF